MFRELRPSLTLLILFFALTGFGYPLLTLQLGQTLMPHQANGSLIEENNKIMGSTLIGQNFISDGYFHSRPSAAGQGYDAANSSGSNLAPTSADLLKTVSDRVNAYRGNSASLVPVDLVTASASGLDPDISPDAAHYQAGRIAAARQVPVTQIENLVKQSIRPPTLGFLGENRVNVLELNRRLDGLAPQVPHQQ